MRRYKNKKKYILPLAAAILLSFIVYAAWPSRPLNSTLSKRIHKTAPAKNISSAAPQFSIDSAASLWALVNKGRTLPPSYVPAGLAAPQVPLRLNSGASEMWLRPDAGQALSEMFRGASAQGISLMLASGYRSYDSQSAVYAGYSSQQGQAAADTFSARPGHSEHQTGLAADIEPANRQCEVDVCFENTPAGQWLKANASQYGFIIRYPKNSEEVTGYQYEPWHFRYVGPDLAAKLNANSKTMEQYFKLPFYKNYPSDIFVLKINE